MNGDLFGEYDASGEGRLTSFHHIIERSDQVLVKRLSRNDRSWADDPGKHQAGFYVPAAQRESGFFPELRSRHDKPHIHEVSITTLWPEIREECGSRLVHYSNKGPETHLTRIPKSEFQALAPASFLVMGRDAGDPFVFHCMTIDAADELAEELEGLLQLQPDFRWDIFEASGIRDAEKEEMENIVAELQQLLESMPEGEWADRFGIPGGREIAARAQNRLMEIYGYRDLNPLGMDAPGDRLNELIKDIEFSIFRRYERMYRLASIVQSMAKDILKPTRETVLLALVREFDTLYEIMKGARQARTSRVGNSLEYHLERMLNDDGVPFSAQAIIGTSRKPDFILPGQAYYGDASTNRRHKVLVLTAKTTLRERWRQPFHESKHCPIYIATLDAGVRTSVLDALGENDAYVVVPESTAELTEETDLHEVSEGAGTRLRKEVRTYRQFFEEDVQRDRMPVWQSLRV